MSYTPSAQDQLQALKDLSKQFEAPPEWQFTKSEQLIFNTLRFGKITPLRTLIEAVDFTSYSSGDAESSEQSVRVLISQMRKKMRLYDASVAIHTERGFGYTLVEKIVTEEEKELTKGELVDIVHSLLRRVSALEQRLRDR